MARTWNVSRPFPAEFASNDKSDIVEVASLPAVNVTVSESRTVTVESELTRSSSTKTGLLFETKLCSVRPNSMVGSVSRVTLSGSTLSGN